MTLSQRVRFEDAERALRLMMAELGDCWIRGHWFEVSRQPYDAVYPTTWGTLEGSGLVRAIRTIGHTRYELSPVGWLRGLELTDRMEDAKEKVGKIIAELKKAVKGRSKEALVYSDSVASRAGVPHGFMCNAIESDFIGTVLRRKTVQVSALEKGGYLLKVPIDFGLDVL